MFAGCFNYFRHGYLGGGLMMFVGLIIIIVIAYYLLKKKENVSSINPIDLLNTKYVNGDISKEEYEEKLDVFKKHNK